MSDDDWPPKNDPLLKEFAGRAVKHRAIHEAFKTFCEQTPGFGELRLDERRRLSLAFRAGAKEGIEIWIAATTEGYGGDEAVAGLTKEILGEDEDEPHDP